MKFLKSLLVTALFFTLATPLSAADTAGEKDGGGVNLKEILFGHIQDAYQWHVTNIGDKPVVISLPMIFYSQQSGMHVYCSSQFAEEYENGMRKGPDGFYIKGAEDEKGQVVETMADGSLQPVCFDISITKNVVVLFINAIVLLLCILIPARWCKKHKVDDAAPGGFTGLMHMFIMSIYNDLVKAPLGKEADRYAPYLLTCFFFILISNILGVMPFPPGGGNLTGNITITFFLALCTFLIVNLTGTREYWKEIFWPEVPWWLKVPAPLMPVIELFGVFTKPIVLMIRLFANMMAGHVIAISLSCIIFIMFGISALLGTSLTIVSVLMSIFMMLLEFLVCYIQAMVFTLLSAMFISMAHVRHSEA